MKSFFTIGIAGHTNHGKTTVCRMLSNSSDIPIGNDKRKMTTDICVHPFHLSGDIKSALIDIPGHIRYRKNAARGLFAVDMIILVIAANDGVMPQTTEHLKLIRHFGIGSGVIVLNKIDLVDDELIELAKMEIREAVSGTILDHAPIIPCAADKGIGADRIKSAILGESERFVDKPLKAPFRMWIDRVLSIQGFGTVVCGTVASGKIDVGDKVRITPGDLTAKIRNIEHLHQKRQKVSAGLRAGINLSGITHQEIHRGMSLEAFGKSHATRFYNVLLSADEQISNRQRVKLYIGTASANARIVLMEQQKLFPGQTGWAQLRLKKPLPVIPHDRFAVCSLNQHTVMGGGTVMEISKRKFKDSRKSIALSYLTALRENDVRGVIVNFCLKHYQRPVTVSEIANYAGLSEIPIREEMAQMMKRREVICPACESYYLKEEYLKFCRTVSMVVETVLIKEPFQGKTGKKAVIDHLPVHYDDLLIEAAIAKLGTEKKIIQKNGFISIPLEILPFTEGQKRILDELEEYIRQMGITAFSLQGFCHERKNGYKKEKIRSYFDFLHLHEKLIRLNDGNYISNDAIEKIKDRVSATIRNKGSITISDSKTVLGFGRTKGGPVFEYLDDIGFTVRKGNERILRP